MDNTATNIELNKVIHGGNKMESDRLMMDTQSNENKMDTPFNTNNIDGDTQTRTSQLSVQSSKNSDAGNNDTINKSHYLKSTLKKSNQAWVDPWEAAVQETFYHKELKQLRPTYQTLNQTMAQIDDMFQNPNSLNEIPDEDEVNPDDLELQEHEEEQNKEKEASKFGAWDGVCAGCLLNIFGVIMFLRVGWMVGQAGVFAALGIILISSVVTVLTTLSMSAICTNGTILGGGAYYIISRALGPSAGGAIGILFSLGMMFAVSLYLIGFAETLVQNLSDAGLSIFPDNPINQVRLYSNIVLVVCLILALIGLKYVIKAQLILLAVIVVSIVSLIIGSFLSWPNKPDLLGVKGYTNGNLRDNLTPQFVPDEGKDYNFWLVLAVFFPAVTGIMAGANISGDLRNPSKDIPLGTLTAVIVSTIVYMGLAVIAGAVVRRSHLIENKLVFADLCIHASIVLIGIYAATLSSGIASLVGAPRILMAIGKDKILPWKWLDYFSVSNKAGEPLRGYFLSFVVAGACNCIGQLNAVAQIISMFFMLAYFMINLACFGLSISKSPGWRPSFKYYNKWTALIGAILCLVTMFLLEWRYALGCCAIGVFIFAYILITDPVVSWGSAFESRLYYHVYKALYRLKRSYKSHVKNWRPGFLILIENPIHKPQLMLFSQTLRKSYGPLFFATIHTGDYRTNILKYKGNISDALGYLPDNAPGNPRGFYETVLADSFRTGAQNLLQLTGMGSLRPNTLVIGFKDKYKTDHNDILKEYVNILRDALMMGYGIMICCGFNRVNWILNSYAPPAMTVSSMKHDIDTDGNDDSRVVQFRKTGSNNTINSIEIKSDNDLLTLNTFRGSIADKPSIHDLPNIQEQPESFKWAQGQSKTTWIDVWWMIDDGGLPLLLGNIMKKHTFWSKCQLRLNLVCDENDIAIDVIKIEEMIKRFRLKYATKPRTIIVKNNNPSIKMIKKYENMAGININKLPRPQVIKRWLKTAELLYKHSKYSGLNIVTLPMPHKKMPSKAYMTLIDLMSDQNKLPPTLIVRGNGQSVLTFDQE